MLWALALLLAFLPAGRQTSSNLEERIMSITKLEGSSAIMTCDTHRTGTYIHWYRFQKGRAPEHLLYYNFVSSTTVVDSRFNLEKYHVYEGPDKRYKFVLRNVEESDSALYYCASWAPSGTSWVKIFAKGTKLVVIPPDKRTDSDFSPKPTIFLPSAAETNLHKAGTYLCLLEKFFPKVIRVYWKEKDGEKILESQEGNTIKTNDRYMKFSWLTVTEDSMAKEHSCIVKHENNKRGVDQEILFPPIGKAFTTINVNPRDSVLRHENVNNATDLEDCMKGRKDMLQLQVTTTYAFYTYLILFFKSMVHLAFVVFCLFRRAAMSCDDQRS